MITWEALTQFVLVLCRILNVMLFTDANNYRSFRTLKNGLENGGPAGLVYGFLFAWAGAVLQALVMAEMASMYVGMKAVSLCIASARRTCHLQMHDDWEAPCSPELFCRNTFMYRAAAALRSQSERSQLNDLICV